MDMIYDSPEKISTELQKFSKTDVDKATDKLDLLISLLPKEYSNLINEAFKYKRIPKEYLLSSILFAVSTSTGLTFYIDAFGYKNYPNLYFTIIGSRGDAKSEAIKIATKPIKDIDDIDYDAYRNELPNNQFDSDKSSIRKQILIQNASIEAAHKIHSENPNSVGILIDEIFALVEKMGNSSSRDGVAWRNFLLEGYTNGYVDVSRKTTESFRINETCPTLLGGLQHQFVPILFANGNLESGFIDRLLFTPKLTSNDKLSLGKISSDSVLNYSNSIKNVLAYKRQAENPDEPIKQFKITLTNEAEETLFKYLQDIINRQLEAKPMIKEYMSKMQISIHKFCVLVFIMKHSKNSTFASSLVKKDLELAIELNEFYFLNFNIIIDQNIKIKEREPTIEQIIKIAKNNNASQKAVGEITGLHKGTVSKKWNK
jgi:hypothetical protein